MGNKVINGASRITGIINLGYTFVLAVWYLSSSDFPRIKNRGFYLAIKVCGCDRSDITSENIVL